MTTSVGNSRQRGVQSLALPADRVGVDKDVAASIAESMVLSRWTDVLHRIVTRYNTFRGKARSERQHTENIEELDVVSHYDLREHESGNSVGTADLPTAVSDCLLFLGTGTALFSNINSAMSCVPAAILLSPSSNRLASSGYLLVQAHVFRSSAQQVQAGDTGEGGSIQSANSIVDYGSCEINVQTAGSDAGAHQRADSKTNESTTATTGLDDHHQPGSHFVRLLELPPSFIRLDVLIDWLNRRLSSVTDSSRLQFAWPLLALARKCAQGLLNLASQAKRPDHMSLHTMSPSTIYVGPGRNDFKCDSWGSTTVPSFFPVPDTKQQAVDAPSAPWHFAWRTGALVFWILTGNSPSMHSVINALGSSNTSTLDLIASMTALLTSSCWLFRYSAGLRVSAASTNALQACASLVAQFLVECFRYRPKHRFSMTTLSSLPFVVAEPASRDVAVAGRIAVADLQALRILSATQSYMNCGLICESSVALPLTLGMWFIERALISPGATLLRHIEESIRVTNPIKFVTDMSSNVEALQKHVQRLARICSSALARPRLNETVLVCLVSSSHSAVLDVTVLCILHCAAGANSIDVNKMHDDTLAMQNFSDIQHVLSSAVGQFLSLLGALLACSLVRESPIYCRNLLNIVAQLYSGKFVCGNGDIRSPLATAAYFASEPKSARIRIISAKHSCCEWTEDIFPQVSEIAADIIIGMGRTSSIDCQTTPSPFQAQWSAVRSQGRSGVYYRTLPRLVGIIRRLNFHSSRVSSHPLIKSGTLSTANRKKNQEGRDDATSSLKLLKTIESIMSQSTNDWGQLDMLCGDLNLLSAVAPHLGSSGGSPSSIRLVAMDILCHCAANCCFRQSFRLGQGTTLSSGTIGGYAGPCSLSTAITSSSFLRYLCALAMQEECIEWHNKFWCFISLVIRCSKATGILTGAVSSPHVGLLRLMGRKIQHAEDVFQLPRQRRQFERYLSHILRTFTSVASFGDSTLLRVTFRNPLTSKLVSTVAGHLPRLDSCIRIYHSATESLADAARACQDIMQHHGTALEMRHVLLATRDFFVRPQAHARSGMHVAEVSTALCIQNRTNSHVLYSPSHFRCLCADSNASAVVTVWSLHYSLLGRSCCSCEGRSNFWSRRQVTRKAPCVL